MILIEAPSSAYRGGTAGVGLTLAQEEEETSGGSTPRGTSFMVGVDLHAGIAVVPLHPKSGRPVPVCASRAEGGRRAQQGRTSPASALLERLTRRHCWLFWRANMLSGIRLL